MVRSAHDVQDLFLRLVFAKNQLQGRFAINLQYVLPLEGKERNRARRRCLKQPGRDQPQMIEQSTGEYRIEYGLAHRIDNLAERDGGQDLDAKPPQVARIGVIRFLEFQLVSPLGGGIPAVADQGEST